MENSMTFTGISIRKTPEENSRPHCRIPNAREEEDLQRKAKLERRPRARRKPRRRMWRAGPQLQLRNSPSTPSLQLQQFLRQKILCQVTTEARNQMPKEETSVCSWLWIRPGPSVMNDVGETYRWVDDTHKFEVRHSFRNPNLGWMSRVVDTHSLVSEWGLEYSLYSLQ